MVSMMRLAVTTDCLSPRRRVVPGCAALAQEMGNSGCQVSVFGVSDERTNEDLSQWLPLRPQVFPLCGPKFFGFAPGMAKAIRAERPDAIELHGLWKFTSIALLHASRRLACPYVVHPHGMLDPWAVRNSSWKKRLAAWGYERRNLQGASCIRALNQGEAAAIRAYGLRNPICIVPNGTDLPDETTKSWASTSPFSPGRKVLLYLGRIHPKKNLTNLLQAWSLVQKSSQSGQMQKDWLLAIAGWDQGGYQAELQRCVSELELHESVAFLGPQFDQQKAACYRHCDAFILPSLSEGLPIVVLDAWSHAKPVLMTAECNLPEGFATGALLEISPSPDEMAEKLHTLVEMTDDQRQSMGQHGLSLVKERFTWPNVAQQMREVYDWVLGGGSPPACIEFNGKAVQKVRNPVASPRQPSLTAR